MIESKAKRKSWPWPEGNPAPLIHSVYLMQNEQCKNHPMGIGPIGDHNLIFARKFRFTLKGDNLPENFLRSAKIDYHNKTIKFVYVDVLQGDKGFHGLIWAYRFYHKALLGETMTLTTYDGCGVPLYEVKFLDLSLEGHASEFDYGINNESTQEITVKFKEYGLHLLSCSPTQLESNWTITVKEDEQEVISNVPVMIAERPRLNIVETEVNYLNAKTWVPGKSSWEPLNIIFTGFHDDLVKAVRSEIGHQFEITLAYKTDSFSETWTLQEAWFADFDYNDLCTRGKIRFNNVSYMPSNTKGRNNE